MGQVGQITGRSLVFRAGPLYCALPLDEVIETMRPLPVQALAGTPAYVKGLSILRGAPTPVIDVAVLLGGQPAPVARYVAVRTERGRAAFATGEVLGIRSTAADPADPANSASDLLGEAANRVVAGVGTYETEPLFLLRTANILPEQFWAGADDR